MPTIIARLIKEKDCAVFIVMALRDGWIPRTGLPPIQYLNEVSGPEQHEQRNRHQRAQCATAWRATGSPSVTT
jgi:hypothetical protein